MTKRIVFLFLILMFTSAHALPVKVGQVKFVKGKNIAKQADKQTRVLVKNMHILSDDTIFTSDGFSILKFDDNTLVTVRPNSSFSVSKYTGSKVVLELNKGAITADTENTSKENIAKYEIKTKKGTIRPQQSKFSMRLCDKGCKREAVVARVLQSKGVVKVKSKDKLTPRKIGFGERILDADKIITSDDSFAMLLFRDNSRVTIAANSDFSIDNYQYQQPGEKDKAFFNLIKGGLRVITGTIGKVNTLAYNITTPVATIGIRGTDFDIFFDSITKKLDSTVNQGKISFKTPKNLYIQSSGESGTILNNIYAPLPTMPAAIKTLTTEQPKPDIKVNLEEAFPAKDEGSVKGLIVKVETGAVKVKTKTTETTMKAGDSVKVDDDKTIFIDNVDELFNDVNTPQTEEAETPDEASGPGTNAPDKAEPKPDLKPIPDDLPDDVENAAETNPIVAYP